jgi:NAD(P)-dependent dehydrogenase (short-subunit alcohol dehydrogenase family)
MGFPGLPASVRIAPPRRIWRARVTDDSPQLGSLLRLDGRTALIVGGYGGLGTVTSELFAELGASLAIAGRSQEKAQALAATLEEGGAARAVGLPVDVTDPASADALVAGAVSELGHLDVLVNLAAVDPEAKAEEFEDADWRQALDVNLSGAFWLSRAAGRAMIEAGGGGRIIHISSTRSVAGGRRGFAAYAASKGGLNTLIKQLATEWGPHGITVNGVGPGFVPTELVQDAAQDERFVNMMRMRVPLGRFGKPFEIASAIAFLASPGAGFITGQILFADGGVTASS